MFAKRETWSSERIELLKRCFDAGLSCSQIAREMGVTRNAVIGKMNRLGLSRPKDLMVRQLEQRRDAKTSKPEGPTAPAPRRPRPSIFAQHAMLEGGILRAAAERARRSDPQRARLHAARARPGEIRWPISTPGAADSSVFCGNEPVEGLPYCPGHARIAYRRAGGRAKARSCITPA